MAARITLERVLRDDDDATGQSVRDWKIEAESGNITIRMKHGTGFLLLRPDHLDQFVMDLNRLKDATQNLDDDEVDR